MASVSTPSPVHLLPRLLRRLPATFPQSFSAASFSKKSSSHLLPSLPGVTRRVDPPQCSAPQLCEHESLTVDWSSLAIGEAQSDDELLAAVRLRVRSFYEFGQTYNIEGHKEYVVEREFVGLKERVAGKRMGFRRVACINATLPLSQLLCPASDLCQYCKFADNGEQRVVVGTLDLNQCLSLADELIGMKPQGTAEDTPRAYLSNVCVAKELHRNGLGHTLVMKSKNVAKYWGITDLYVHVAVDNEAARKLYEKNGFIFENEEPSWQARFLGRPRRFLLWTGLKQECPMAVSFRFSRQSFSICSTRNNALHEIIS